MGEIADDCHDRMCDEMEERDANPDWDGYHSPRIYFRPQPAPSKPKPVVREWTFKAIDRTWPFRDHGYMVPAATLEEAVTTFFSNEWHVPYTELQQIPPMSEVKQERHGGWTIQGDTQTVLVFVR
jgi:hypothetical protein